MTVLSDSVREVLESDGLAHLVTLNPDGSPQVTCVWIGLEGDEIVCAHLGRFQKVKNIERDPRVTLSVEAPGENAIGMKHYLVVHGKARITEGGAPELLQKLAETYVGPGVKFPPMPDPPPGVVTRITPERVGGMGPWTSSPN
jgi:PPOX class probable F420-dependent enzyme